MKISRLKFNKGSAQKKWLRKSNKFHFHLNPKKKAQHPFQLSLDLISSGNVAPCSMSGLHSPHFEGEKNVESITAASMGTSKHPS
jgi:hypothetical protein